jgi:hypothetical protein
MSRRTIAFWLLFAATLCVYIVIVAWSIPMIAAEAGGLTPFDMRPGGYSFDQAKAFLTALSPRGVEIYLGPQQRLDLAYPALLSATLFFAIYLMAPERWGRWRWLLAATALPSAAFDYLENHAVRVMLQVGADGITPAEVAIANRWTVLKSATSTIAMVILLALLIGWTANRLTAVVRARRLARHPHDPDTRPRT